MERHSGTKHFPILLLIADFCCVCAVVLRWMCVFVIQSSSNRVDFLLNLWRFWQISLPGEIGCKLEIHLISSWNLFVRGEIGVKSFNGPLPSSSRVAVILKEYYIAVLVLVTWLRRKGHVVFPLLAREIAFHARFLLVNKKCLLYFMKTWCHFRGIRFLHDRI